MTQTTATINLRDRITTALTSTDPTDWDAYKAALVAVGAHFHQDPRTGEGLHLDADSVRADAEDGPYSPTQKAQLARCTDRALGDELRQIIERDYPDMWWHVHDNAHADTIAALAPPADGDDDEDDLDES